MKSILVPVDGSESAGRAAAFAGKLAAAFAAKLTLLHAYDAPAAALLGMAHSQEAAIRETLNRIAERSFEGARAAMSLAFGEGLSWEAVQKVATAGNPAREIVAHAKGNHSDLIVMGSRGLSVIQEITVGSVSDRVLRLAPCAVTIVR